MKKTLPLR